MYAHFINICTVNGDSEKDYRKSVDHDSDWADSTTVTDNWAKVTGLW